MAGQAQVRDFLREQFARVHIKLDRLTEDMREVKHRMTTVKSRFPTRPRRRPPITRASRRDWIVRGTAWTASSAGWISWSRQRRRLAHVARNSEAHPRCGIGAKPPAHPPGARPPIDSSMAPNAAPVSVTMQIIQRSRSAVTSAST